MITGYDLRRASLQGELFDTRIASWLVNGGSASPEAQCDPAYLRRRVAELGLNRAMDLEMALLPVVVGMGQRGVYVDQALLDDIIADYRDQYEFHVDAASRIAGECISPHPNDRLGTILFDELGLRPAPPKVRNGAAYSTAQCHLEAVERVPGQAHIVDHVIIARRCSRTLSVWLEPLKKYSQADGRVHSDWDQIGAVTGRFSCGGAVPLMNVPVDPLRRVLAAPPGRVLVVADYGQIDLRSLAYASGDPAMIADFRAGVDIHSRTATWLSEVLSREVSRAEAKVVNLALPYGLGVWGLARNLEIELDEALPIERAYFERYARLATWMCETKASIRQTSSVTMPLFNRFRALRGPADPNDWRRWYHAEKEGINTVGQGTSADIIKVAMVKLTDDLAALDAHIVMQVHDELVVEAPELVARAVVQRVKSVMETCLGKDFPVPLKVKVGTAQNWWEAK